ncbi:MAG: hypothetical protein R3293_19825 [Candidatus Promineifilaceae bacterium]|nr:hypothetical protein [Candidatus Promineifilaceae bacterium]
MTRVIEALREANSKKLQLAQELKRLSAATQGDPALQDFYSDLWQQILAAASQL